MNFVLSFLILLLISGCTLPSHQSKKVPSSNSHPNPSETSIKNHQDNGKSESLKETKIIAGPYSLEKIIKSLPLESWEKTFNFEIIDNRNGYAKMNLTDYEGFNEFFLFTGTPKNLLVKVNWGCRPTCQQMVYIFELNNNIPKAIHFKSILHTSLYDKFKDDFNVCININKFNSFKPDNKCFIMFEFPKAGTATKMYQASSFDNGKFQTEYGDAKLLGQLLWDKASFRFTLQ